LRFNAGVTERQSVSWRDGTPQSTEPGTGSGVFFRGVGEGYELTLPADGNVRTARVYLGGWRARGRLEVSLSDASAAPFQTTFENAEGIFDRVVTIIYSAGSAGQTLTLRFVMEANRAIRNGITGDQDGPDLFGFFYTDVDGDGVPDVARISLYNDRFHFNGLGHHIVALLWYNALIGDATGTSIAPFYLSEPSVSGYQQNLLDRGDDLRVDDFETLTSFPSELAKGIWVMAARRSKRPMAAIGYSSGPTLPARRSYSAATRRTARTPA
jgi:hypothetical protein